VTVRNRIGLLALILWGITLAGFTTLFVRGYTTTSPDGRIAVIVTDAEKDIVLAEMRGMLQAVADITGALAREDHAAIAAAAKTVGSVAMQNDPPALLAKLPLHFKLSGMAMHESFDRIEAAARASQPVREITALLGHHLSLCTSCHASYRFTPP
jgi:hypothetical protein